MPSILTKNLYLYNGILESSALSLIMFKAVALNCDIINTINCMFT